MQLEGTIHHKVNERKIPHKVHVFTAPSPNSLKTSLKNISMLDV